MVNSIEDDPANCSLSECGFVFESESEVFESNGISGNRIVNIQYLFNQLKSINHTGFNCSFFDLNLISEKQMGLRSVFTFQCNVCKLKNKIYTEDPKTNVNINKLAISAIVVTGGGYSQLEEIYAVMNMPTMSNKTYLRYHNSVSVTMKDEAWKEMKKAGEEEHRIAIEEGNVDHEGVPTISVIVDGAWSKRSYRTNYNALSGVACIIGVRTKKVLYVGVKNKYCTICAKENFNKDKESNDHVCYKNWNGPSTGMESCIILEGFRASMDMHNLKYSCIIGDGDSSVYRKIIEAMPYGPQLLVRKIGCKNHILRCYLSKLKDVMNSHKEVRHHLKRNLYKFHVGVSKAIEFRRKQDIAKEHSFLLKLWTQLIT